MYQPKVLREFCEAFGLYLEEGTRKFYKQKAFPRTINYDDVITVETVGSLCIHIPEDKLSEMCSMLEEINLENKRIRQHNPAVQKAYDKYLMLLALVKEQHD